MSKLAELTDELASVDLKERSEEWLGAISSAVLFEFENWKYGDFERGDCIVEPYDDDVILFTRNNGANGWLIYTDGVVLERDFEYDSE